MIKVPTHNLEGKEIGTINLPKNIFGVEINDDLIYLAINAQLANSRFNLAHTKNRGEVRGGGRKPWRQKGTGRARHGSIRSPLWRGGGVSFGPRNDENYSRKINKKARKKALLMVLSSKVRDKELVVLDELKISEPKTKLMSSILNNIFDKKQTRNVLIAISPKNKNAAIASRNLSGTKTIFADSLNILDLLSFKHLLLDKESIAMIEKIYGTI